MEFGVKIFEQKHFQMEFLLRSLHLKLISSEISQFARIHKYQVFAWFLEQALREYQKSYRGCVLVRPPLDYRLPVKETMDGKLFSLSSPGKQSGSKRLSVKSKSATLEALSPKSISIQTPSVIFCICALVLCFGG